MKSNDISVSLKDINRNSSDRQALLAGGGKTQVPCLRIEKANGPVTWLYESADIIKFLKSNA